jgi:uncharacterized protein YijF (DUF1287 family)
LGIDLQKEAHEDIEVNFWTYPNHLRWMQVRADANISHRRAPNLMVVFSRKKKNFRSPAKGVTITRENS